MRRGATPRRGRPAGARVWRPAAVSGDVSRHGGQAAAKAFLTTAYQAGGSVLVVGRRGHAGHTRRSDRLWLRGLSGSGRPPDLRGSGGPPSSGGGPGRGGPGHLPLATALASPPADDTADAVFTHLTPSHQGGGPAGPPGRAPVRNRLTWEVSPQPEAWERAPCPGRPADLRLRAGSPPPRTPDADIGGDPAHMRRFRTVCRADRAGRAGRTGRTGLGGSGQAGPRGTGHLPPRGVRGSGRRSCRGRGWRRRGWGR